MLDLYKLQGCTLREREQQSLPVSHGSKHHGSHQEARHVDRRAKTVQSGLVAHQVPLVEGKIKQKWSIHVVARNESFISHLQTGGCASVQAGITCVSAVLLKSESINATLTSVW